MTGSLQIKKQKSGNSYYYILLNFYDKNGKRILKWIPTGLEVKGNKRKAEELLAREIAKHDTNIIDVNSNMLFADYIELFLESIKPDIELSTYEGYCLHAKHPINYFRTHKLRLCDLKVLHFEEYYKTMLTEGKTSQKTGEKSSLSVRTVRSHKFIINAALNKAVANEIIRSNPAANVKVTNKTKRQIARKIEFLTLAETNALMKFLEAKKDNLSDLIYATVHYGLRRSEVLGLTIDAIDFNNKKLHIKRTITKVSTLHDKNDTKTPDSYRTYTLTDEMADFFQNVLKKREANKKYFGNTYHDSNFLFTWEDGHLFAPEYVYHHFKILMKEFGRPQFTFHNLRHTTASILFEQGWQPKSIQEWLGHADFYTTMNIYTHIAKWHNSESAHSLVGLIQIPKPDIFDDC